MREKATSRLSLNFSTLFTLFIPTSFLFFSSSLPPSFCFFSSTLGFLLFSTVCNIFQCKCLKLLVSATLSSFPLLHSSFLYLPQPSSVKHWKLFLCLLLYPHLPSGLTLLFSTFCRFSSPSIEDLKSPSSPTPLWFILPELERLSFVSVTSSVEPHAGSSLRNLRDLCLLLYLSPVPVFPVSSIYCPVQFIISNLESPSCLPPHPLLPPMGTLR